MLSKTQAARDQLLNGTEVLQRLPVTFSTYLLDQTKDPGLLFPAEKDYYARLLALLNRSEPALLDRLFAPVREIERRMGVSERTWPAREFSLAQVDFLNRSPFYAEWRRAIAAVFAEIDPVLDAAVTRAGHPRLVVVTTPAQLPVGPDRMWMRVRRHGRLVKLDVPSDLALDDFLPLLLTGGRRAEGRESLLDLYASKRSQAHYDAWLVEARDALSQLVRTDAAVRISYDRLQDYRGRLMAEVRDIVQSQDIRGPRQLSERLHRLKTRAPEGYSDVLMAHFLQTTLLNGNGTLLINNTFVEWAAMQAIRRARPSLAVISFGVRNRIKPFISLLIFNDQERADVIPTQADTLGSYVDLEMFHEYLWTEFEKYPEYRRNTAYIFVAEGMDEMLVIAPPDFPLLAASQPAKLPGVFSTAREWLNV